MTQTHVDRGVPLFGIKPVCVLCGEPAVTTAAHILVCEEHRKAYDDEGRRYLPSSERVVYQSLLQAERRK